MSPNIFGPSVLELSRQESSHVVSARALRSVEEGVDSAISEMNPQHELRKGSWESRRLVSGGSHIFGCGECFGKFVPGDSD
jgi:hypothetical protein